MSFQSRVSYFLVFNIPNYFKKYIYRRRQVNSSSDTSAAHLETTSGHPHYLTSSRYFENPLTAVTSAMLQISETSQSQNDDDANNNNTNNINALQSNITHQIHQVHNGNGTTYEYYKISGDKDGIQWTTR